MSVIDLTERIAREAEPDIPFAETSVFHDLSRIVDSAIRVGGNASFIGVPGTGKSCAAIAYAERFDDVRYLRLTQTTSRSNKALMAAICGAIGQYDDGPPQEMERRILKSEWFAAVILDEGQYLEDERMDHLAHLSATDGGRLVFIVIGNPRMKITIETAAGKHGGIARRFIFRHFVEGITRADTDAIASAAGVEGMDAYRALREIGAKHHADGVVSVLRIARRLAAPTTTVKGAHIQQAIELLPQYRPVQPKR